ncbi:MAG: hypothetical protein FJZ01_17320 [Candidatus Sericytochromatia bacterium]|nr:hypothetical protein [Candidatus Tanganyikabacteria bacterium]
MPRKGRGVIRWEESSPGQAAGAPPDLAGCVDPLDGTLLEPGERVVVCLSCGTGYHQASWDFLLAHNAGACCNCRFTSELTYVVLGLQAAAAPAADERGKIVRLEDLPGHVNMAVVFEGKVLSHHVSAATGTHFVKFHGDSNPFKGFKLVIFASEVHRWLRVAQDPATYVGQTLQARGLLKDHPRYGLEILPKSPDAIKIIH